MNRNVIIAAVVGVLIFGAGVFAVVGSGGNDDADDNVNTSNQSSNSGNLVSNENPLGIDISPLEPPYRITINTQDSDGRTTNAVSEVDADGDISSVVTDEGEEVEIRAVDGATYSRDPQGNWTKFPAVEGEEDSVSGDNLDIGFTDEDLDDIRESNIVDKGTGPCQAGTCRIYEFTDPNGDQGTVKVAEDTNRISEIDVTTADGEVNSIVFAFDNSINVVAPENYTEFEIPEIDLDNPDIDIEALLESAPTGNTGAN